MLTDHAETRRLQMGVAIDEIEQAISDPELSYPGNRSHPDGRRVYVRGRVAVVVGDDAVVTVLWNGKDHERPPLLPGGAA